MSIFTLAILQPEIFKLPELFSNSRRWLADATCDQEDTALVWQLLTSSLYVRPQCGWIKTDFGRDV